MTNRNHRGLAPHRPVAPGFRAEANPPLPEHPTEVLTTFPFGPAVDLRLITAPNLNLILGVADWSLRHRLLLRPELEGAICYGIVGHARDPSAPAHRPAIYWGQTEQCVARFKRHGQKPRVRAPEAIIVLAGAYPGALGPEMALGLEYEVSRRTRAAGRFLAANEFRGPALRPAQQTTLRNWADALVPLLRCAGYPALHQGTVSAEREPRPDSPETGPLETDRMRPHLSPSFDETTSAVRAGWSEHFPVDIESRRDAQRFELAYGEVRARAVIQGPWTVIQAGAVARREPIPSHQSCLAAKLEAMTEAGLFAAVPGRADLMRLTRSIALPSLTNGVRLLVGDNGSANRWRRVA